MKPRFVLGVGNFARDRARTALEGVDVTVGSITHPSPANPVANRGWAHRIEEELTSLGIKLPDGKKAANQ